MMLTRQEILSSKEPLLFRKKLDWTILNWSEEEWKFNLNKYEQTFPFRRGYYQCSTEPLWETKCDTEFKNMSDFFSKYNKLEDDDNFWLYFDYKHLSQWLTDTFKDFTWSCVGFPERDVKKSTLWMGTKGANTPCHQDTYGCNIIAQLHGKKMWILFDPSETDKLQPTRVPYEESSIYSRVNFSCTCHKFPDIKNARCVILEPGDILYVPNHWWHYVENITSAISINTWIPLESDEESRIDESLVKCFISSIIQEVSVVELNELLLQGEGDLPIFKTYDKICELSFLTERIKHIKTKNKECTAEKAADENLVLKKKLSNYLIPTQPLQDIVQNKGRCKFLSKLEEPESNGITVKTLINSYCHPDVIENVRKKLFEEINLNLN